MNRQAAIERMKQILAEEAGTFERKNSDYSGKEAEDAFTNFRMIEHLTQGKITAEEGIFVRMVDKMTRIWNLLHQPAAVLDEKGQDTCRDLSVYANILEMIWDEREVDSEYAGMNAASETVGKDGLTEGQRYQQQQKPAPLPNQEQLGAWEKLVEAMRSHTGQKA